MSKFEYRIPKDNPCLVEVRRVKVRRLHGRGQGWRTYYAANTPQDAQRILQLLNEPATADEMVMP